MKIKTKELSYEEVLALPREKHRNPMRQTGAVRLLLKAVSFFDLRAVGFTFEKTGMEKLGAKEPCLILMNHSSFIDLKNESIRQNGISAFSGGNSRKICRRNQ